MSAAGNDSAPQSEVRPLSATDELLDSVAMLSHSRPGPVAGLKRRLEMQIEHVGKRDKSMLEEVTTVVESMDLGIA